MAESLLRRRRVLVLAAGGLSACDRLPALAGTGEALSDEDKALKRKFRGLRGVQLRVDSMFPITGLNIFDEKEKLFFAQSAFDSPLDNYIGSYGAEFGVPKFIRSEWRSAADEWGMDGATGAFAGGTILGNHTVPVASRIPDEVMDAYRKGVGGFRLKIRMHRGGPLIGWDLSRGFNLQYFAGGDFREADIENGKVLRKGWYIHPRTKERIETDF
jgi:hypothetical protein